jgi:hypothetical protein
MFIKNGKIITLSQGIPFTDRIAPGNYMLRYDAMTGYYLEESPDTFTLPKRLFGKDGIDSDTTRWLNTFDRTTKNTGVLLCGIRGSGKTITAQYLCQKANRPVIHVVEKIPESLRESFLMFMSAEEFSGAIVMLDEFEKVFGRQSGRDIEQDDMSILPMLQLMEGMFSTHLMFVLTTNGDVNQHFENRLGRIRYRKNYDTLPESIVSDVIDQTMNDGKDKDALKDVILRIGVVTYDMLYHIVDEINHSEDDIRDCICRLNIVPQDMYYSVTIKYTGQETPGIRNVYDANNMLWFSCNDNYVNPWFDQEFDITIRKSLLREHVNGYAISAEDSKLLLDWCNRQETYGINLRECQITDLGRGILTIHDSAKNVTVKLRPMARSDFFDLGEAFTHFNQEKKHDT